MMNTYETGLGRSGRRLRAGGVGLAIVLGVVVAAGCGDSDAGSSGGSGTAAASSPHVGKSVAIVYAADGGYTRQIVCGAREEGVRLGFEMHQAQGPKQYDPAKQVAMTNAALARSPDALVYNPSDPKSSLPPVKPAVARGMKLVAVDTPLADESVVTSFIASDHHAGGQVAAREVIRQIGGRGKVLAVGLIPDHPITKGRVGGFESVIESEAGIEYLGARYPELDIAKVAADVAAILRRNPDIKAIYSSENTIAGAGVVTALRDAGLKGKVKHVSWDYDPIGVKFLKSGDITGLVAQNPREMGRVAIRQLANAFDGKPVEKAVHPPVTIVTPENQSDPRYSTLFYSETC